MSASSKKKLRREQNNGQLTERQIQEQKEAKKLKILTIVFVAVVAVALIIALTVGISKVITRTGILERKTVALTVDGNEISSAELSYYYVDAINSFYNNLYSQFGTSASAIAKLYGVDVTAPLGDQVYDEETGDTWADYFIDQAISSATSTYALCNAAEKAGYTLTEDDQASLDSAMSSMALYAAYYGYKDVESYLKAMYGFGSTEESYKEYYTMSILAYSYQTSYYNGLEYEDSELREYDAKEPKEYNSYSYAVYSLAASRFYEGGTKDEDGKTVYSDAEKEAGLKAAEEAANSLLEGAFDMDSPITLEYLNEAIAALPINAESESAAATVYTDKLYASVLSGVKDWVCDDARQEGDATVIPVTTETTDENGETVSTTTGYYVVLFQERSDNTFTLPSVRHLLVAFEGGTKDDSGNTVYSDDEKAAAKAEAEALLKQWQDGEATEDSFAALVTEKTDDTASKEDGGLYTDIVPGYMVTNFNDWCFEEGRQSGDTGVIETEYGYHVMYYVSAGETTYRDYMIKYDMRSEDLNEWYEALIEAVSVTEGSISRMNRDFIISG